MAEVSSADSSPVGIPSTSAGTNFGTNGMGSLRNHLLLYFAMCALPLGAQALSVVLLRYASPNGSSSKITDFIIDIAKKAPFVLKSTGSIFFFHCIGAALSISVLQRVAYPDTTLEGLFYLASAASITALAIGCSPTLYSAVNPLFSELWSSFLYKPVLINSIGTVCAAGLAGFMTLGAWFYDRLENPAWGFVVPFGWLAAQLVVVTASSSSFAQSVWDWFKN